MLEDRKSRRGALGASLVALASVLWATDGVLRAQALVKLDPLLVVLIEQLIGLAILPILLIHQKSFDLLLKGGREWAAAAFVGIAGSGVGVLLFTASFHYIDPTVAMLLQKLQPVLIVLFGFLILGERPSRHFLVWALVAGLAALVVSFPGDGHSPTVGSDQFFGALMALGACMLWAMATIAGKLLLRNTAPAVAVFWRYLFGCLTLLVIALVRSHDHPLDTDSLHLASELELAGTLLALTLVSGIFPLWLFYEGLSRTSASVAGFVELIYPVTAVLLNAWVMHSRLAGPQLAAAAVLIFAVTRIVFESASSRSGVRSGNRLSSWHESEDIRVEGLRVQELRHLPKSSEIS
jgi:drug/metabolite transporter (DMT)-like permease